MTADGGRAGDGRAAGDRPRRRWLRWTAIGLAVVVGLVLVGVGVWIALLPETEAEPLAAVLADPDLVVEVDAGGASIAPVAGPVTGTVVFYPGAGVPPQAYLPTWAPVVEDTGVRVVVPSVPLRLAVLDPDTAADVRPAVVEVDPGAAEGDWWVGGHSLGGAMAASFVAGAAPGEWDGLVLWAAYPAGDDLASRDDLQVVSVSGTRDGLTTPAEVEDSRADLPEDAEFAVLEGVNHAQFAAYGDQRGDGEPTVDDARARELIAEATAAGLTSTSAGTAD